MFNSINILGEKLEECSCHPKTGFFRDGRCNTSMEDNGMHTVCAEMSPQFLAFSKKMGNDLSSPNLAAGFPGLKPGDHWCLCASRWLEAYKAGHAPKIILEATHEETVAVIPLELLQEYAL